MKKNNQNQVNNSQENQKKRGLGAAFKGAKQRTCDAMNSITARDGAFAAVGAAATIGVGVGVNAYRKHQASKAEMVQTDGREDRRRQAM